MHQIYLRSAIAAAVLTASQASFASLIFNADVTPGVIFGSGNDNGGFTVDRSNGVELGLRGKLRHDASGKPQNIFNSNGNGTYSFNPGVAPTQTLPTAEWSFEWAVNTNFDNSTSFTLDDLRYELGLDTDPSQGVVYGSLFAPLPNPFDPINVVAADHALGDNTTVQCNSTKTNTGCRSTDTGNSSLPANYVSDIGRLNVAQNSWKPSWFIDGFDPTIDATYDIYLAAFDDAGNQVARTGIQIIVGAGGAPIPGPGTLALLGLGLAGFGFARRKATT